MSRPNSALKVRHPAGGKRGSTGGRGGRIEIPVCDPQWNFNRMTGLPDSSCSITGSSLKRPESRIV